MNDQKSTTFGKPFLARRIALLIIALFLLPVFGCNQSMQTQPSETVTPVVLNTAMVTPSPVATPTPIPPTPTPSPTPAPFPEQFSVIWLADTQNIAYHLNDGVFQTMGEWILEQEDPLNIKYIVQTGDMVDNGYKENQWRSFDVLLRQFYGKIPYLPIAGNHDLGVKLEDYSAYVELPFVKAFPKDQIYDHGRAVYAAFQAGGENFLLLGAGWNEHVTSAVWMNEVLRAHPNHIAILMFHSYINAEGELSRPGTEIHDMIVAKNPNVRLVLCGHLRGNGYRLEEFDDDGDGEEYANEDFVASFHSRMIGMTTYAAMNCANTAATIASSTRIDVEAMTTAFAVDLPTPSAPAAVT